MRTILAGLPGLAAATATAPAMGTGEVWLFWILAPIAVLAALGMLFAKKAVHSALLLALVMFCLAVFYIAEQAPFLGIVQIVVYTGAVMMLFLFVLMLVGVDSSDSLVETLRGQRLAGLLAGAGFAALLMGGIGSAALGTRAGLGPQSASRNVVDIATLLFTRYTWAFEITSALLITAALGTMVLAHRERTAPRPTQRELSEQRFRSGGQLTPLPAPGVFARHNGVHVPGLLPDGTPSELSINKVLAARGDIRSGQELDTPGIAASTEEEK